MRRLDELRLVERPDVLRQGRRAATLTRRTDAVVFRYDEAYREGGGPPVAITLPLGSEP